MAKETRIFQIFKAGTHTSSHGQTSNYSIQDLNAIAQSYNPFLFEAPLVLGHPEMDAPSYGHVTKLFVSGDGLYADATVDEQLISLVRDKRFTSVSASFYLPGAPSNPVPSSLYLRHVGFLGGHAPAVKGMAPLNFQEYGGIAGSTSRSKPVSPLVEDAIRRANPGYQGSAEFGMHSSRSPLVQDAIRRSCQSFGGMPINATSPLVLDAEARRIAQQMTSGGDVKMLFV